MGKQEFYLEDLRRRVGGLAFSVNLSVVEVGGLLDNLEKTFPGGW